jgi:hypothetical protein
MSDPPASESIIETQARSKNYREDTLFQLKLELDTSMPSNNKMTFTKNLLNLKGYKGRPLDMYPYFAPYKVYRKAKIQRMTYLERVELFFNRQRFEQVIFGRKSKTKKKMAKRKRIEMDEGLESLKDKNFVFTVKMLFSTAFPIVDNFSQSSDYFNQDITRSFSFKGTNLEFFPFLSGKFDKKFSHLNLGGEIYTVTKVIWVNDVFNHPLYNRIVDNYRKIKDDMEALSIREEGLIDRKEKLMKVLYDEKDEKWNPIVEAITSYTTNMEKSRISETLLAIKTAETDIKAFRMIPDKKNTPETTSTATTKITKVELKTFFDKHNNISNKSENESYKQALSAIWRKVGSLVPSIESIIKTSFISGESRRFLNGISNDVDDINIMSTAIDYIKKFEFRFPKESRERRQKIKDIIRQIFPKANEFSEQLANFAKDRNIGNEKWNRLIQSRQLDETVKKSFDKLALCYTNDNCNVQDDDASRYIEVKLDEITNRPQDATVEMYEAFLQVNIIEGEVTNKNYNKIKCTYLDEELDNFLDNFINPQDDWNVQNEKNFFSVKEVVQQANQALGKEKTKRQEQNRESSVLRAADNVLKSVTSPFDSSKNNKNSSNNSKNKKGSKRNSKKKNRNKGDPKSKTLKQQNELQR